MKLTDIDKRSTLWRDLSEHVEQQIAGLHKRNESLLSPEQTAHVRGQIFALRSILALATERQVLTDPPPGR